MCAVLSIDVDASMRGGVSGAADDKLIFFSVNYDEVTNRGQSSHGSGYFLINTTVEANRCPSPLQSEPRFLASGCVA